MGNKKGPPKPPPVLLTNSLLSELRSNQVVICHSNPLSRALHAITRVARGEAYRNKPRALARVGRQLSGLIPYGYSECFDPPLSVKQLAKILADPDSIPYLQSVEPGTIGLMIIGDFNSIVKHYKK
ncbi:MAG: hypothetical protein QG675_325 [Patescibacteria group bacterium]|jgi:hypothetical protein|nr:hypothetical protein [Patescibacteria group bacterium]